MKVITEEIRAKLREPLPKEAVKAHPTKTYLSSIKAIYVVERLNDVFGVGSWKLKTEVIDNKTAHIIVKAHLSIPEYGVELESFGGNDNGGENSKNFDLGDAYKGASTDAFTKICSFLEIGIDVFKGLVDNKQQSSEQRPPVKDDNRPWLNDKQLEKIVSRIQNGEHQLKETAIKEFRMKKEYKEKILAA